MTTSDHVDVLIIGAGISGIGMACHLTRESPGRTYRILERRQQIGGTWDLFRYPGIRSDSDMFTFGFNFRPWSNARTLADGESIRNYVHATADEYRVAEHITFGTKVARAEWSTDAGFWTVHTVDEATGEPGTVTATFVVNCTGYYDYDQGYRPRFPGEERFGGQVVHPQHWPDELDYADKRVVIIGSGATAVTLVPAMAADAAHVTMLQRSPTYILSLPAVDPVTKQAMRLLPKAVATRVTRARNIAQQRLLYELARRRPEIVRALVRRGALRMLGGASDIAHFTPTYQPWDQRLCIVPDGDLFRAIRNGDADVVTDAIETFTEDGIQLTSGQELAADIIVTATGLRVQLLGGAELVVDGEPVVVRDTVTYKGVLLSGVPNSATVFGYTNASWTLKADLACEYTCRLLNHMQAHGYTQVVAEATEADRGEDSVLGSLSSGYVRRGNDRLPRQGTHGAWKVNNDYLRDAPMLKYGAIADDVLRFSSRQQAAIPSLACPTTSPSSVA